MTAPSATPASDEAVGDALVERALAAYCRAWLDESDARRPGIYDFSDDARAIARVGIRAALTAALSARTAAPRVPRSFGGKHKPLAMCPASCGCLWTDNGDGSMSLFGENSRSCDECEMLPWDSLLPVSFTARTAAPAEQGVTVDGLRDSAVRELWRGKSLEDVRRARQWLDSQRKPATPAQCDDCWGHGIVLDSDTTCRKCKGSGLAPIAPDARSVEEVGGYQFKDAAGNLWVSVGGKLPDHAQSEIQSIPRLPHYAALYCIAPTPLARSVDGLSGEASDYEVALGRLANGSYGYFPCQKCGHPVAKGCRCIGCGDDSPTQPHDKPAPIYKAAPTALDYQYRRLAGAKVQDGGE